MFNAGYRMLGAGALGWPREMVWGGRWEAGFRIGNTNTLVVDSCWCMAKPIQYCKSKKKKMLLLLVLLSHFSRVWLCDPIDGSPLGSRIPGILQARTLEWVAISFSNAWKWKQSRSVVSNPQWPHELQASRLFHPWDFPGKSTGVGCQCLLRI